MIIIICNINLYDEIRKVYINDKAFFKNKFTSFESHAASFNANDNCTKASTPPGGSPKKHPI
jgi:hypothetical protein